MTRIEFTRQTTPLKHLASIPGGKTPACYRDVVPGTVQIMTTGVTCPVCKVSTEYRSRLRADARARGAANPPRIRGGAGNLPQFGVLSHAETAGFPYHYSIRCQWHCLEDGSWRECQDGLPKNADAWMKQGSALRRLTQLRNAHKPPRIRGGSDDHPDAGMVDAITSAVQAFAEMRIVRAHPRHDSYCAWAAFRREYETDAEGSLDDVGFGILRSVIREMFPGCLETGAGTYGLRIVPRIAGGVDDHPDAQPPSDEATFTIHGVTRHWEAMPCQYGFGIRCQNHCLPEVISPVGGCDKAKSFYRRYEDAQRDADAFATEYNFPLRIAGGADIPDSVLDFVRTQITAEPDSWLPEADALAAYRAHVGRKRIKANERDGIAPALLSGYGVKYLAIFPDGEEQLGFRGVGLRTAPEPPQRDSDAPPQAPTVGRSHAHPPIPGREPLDHTNLDHDHLPDPAPPLDEDDAIGVLIGEMMLAPSGEIHQGVVNQRYADILGRPPGRPDFTALYKAIKKLGATTTRPDKHGNRYFTGIAWKEPRAIGAAATEERQNDTKRRASRAQAQTDAFKADFPSCKQCGSGSQTIDEDGACRDRRSCDARRMARSQTDADAARERVKVKRAKRMQDAVSESTLREEGDGPGSFPAVSAEQRDSMARWLIAITEPKSGEWTAWESIYRAYGWNEWNGAGDGKKMYPNINERNALSDALRGIYPTAAWTKHSGIGGIDNMKLLDAPVWPDPVPADKRDHISEPRKPLPQPEAETLEPIRLVRFKCVKCGSESQSREVCFTSEELTSEVENLRVAHNAIMHPPAPITTPFTTESDIPLPSFDPPARTLPDNVRDAVDQHPDAARFVVNGLEKSPDGGAVPCKALRACMSKYLGRSCTLQEVAAMEAIAGFQYGMTYENRFGSEVFANVQIVSVVTEPSPLALIPDSDAPSPQNDPDLIDRYIAAVEYRKRLEDELDQAKQQTAEFEEPLRQLFIETGTQSVNRRGWSVHMRRDLWARVLGEDRDKAYAALRALPEWQHLVTETVNAQSLKSTVRSLQESRGLAKGASDEELAAGILPASLRAHIGLGRQTTIRATRSRKS